MRTRIILLVFGCALIAACHEQPAELPAESHITLADDQGRLQANDPANELSDLADQFWQHQLATSPYFRLREGLPVTELPDLTLEQAEQDAQFAQELLSRLERIAPAELEHEDWLTLEILRWYLTSLVDAPQYYWLEFVVTPYASSSASSGIQFIHQTLGNYPLGSSTERDGYLLLLDEYAVMLEQRLEKTRGQAERAIRIPKPALAGVVKQFTGHRALAEKQFPVSPERLAGLQVADRKAFSETVSQRIATRILPAFDRLLGYLDDDYYAAAPATVGLSQYPNGEAYYRFLVRHYTTLDVAPEAIFEYGEQRMQAIAEEMAAIQASLGFDGSTAEFNESLATDRRFFVDTPEELEQLYQSHIRMIEPLIGTWFSMVPKAPYGVRRADPAAEAGLTFGYYQPPTPDNPVGEYRYNASHLDQQSQIGVMGLIYHELIPGHHFHIAVQAENETLPKFRRELWSIGAYLEGWAVYASALSGEMGLMTNPYDRYGSLQGESFRVARLVVDTGMNVFGWSRQDAQDYMVRMTFRDVDAIASETLRYATDIPGQALSYQMGYRALMNMREKAQMELGDTFDIREFHDIILGSGAMPMQVLQKHVDWYIAQKKSGTPDQLTD